MSYLHATVGGSISLASTQATGGSGSDTLRNVENLYGSRFDDTLSGDSGNNMLTGSLGRDSLTGGGGADRFRYNAAEDTGVTVALRDSLHDFSSAQGDKIDLSPLDADSALAGNQASVCSTKVRRSPATSTRIAPRTSPSNP